MPKIDIDSVPNISRPFYPEPYASAMGDRSFQELGEAAGLSQFGAVLMTMKPGSRSSLRHWHRNQDEFAIVTEGELVLHDNSGETIVRPGDCIGWPKNDGDGHCLLTEVTPSPGFW